MTERYDLSRRKVLGGLTTIGIAGAGAGLGTSALFTDEESFVNNSITAGTLDMEVTATIEAANPEYEDAVGDVVGLSSEADGEVAAGFTLDDFKPGDWVIICIDILIVDNPACISLSVDDTANDDNGLTEPEENEAGDTTGGEGEGELAQNLDVTLFNDFATEGDSKDDLDDVLEEERSLQEFWESFEEPELLFGGATEVTFYALIELPVEVGNVVQSDSVEFDAVFNAVQARNNEDCEIPDEGDTAT